MSVTVVSCVYGDYYGYVPAWTQAVTALDPVPDAVSLATDEWIPAGRGVGMQVGADCTWKHPQAFYLAQAVSLVSTDWLVIADIDDTLHPDALAGLDNVTADVWQMGFDRSDGEHYIPPTLTADQVLALDRNVLVGSSAIRTEAFHAVGGFPDIALQDWGLWRRMARAGRTFKSSGRTHFRYMRHPDTRGAVELTADARAAHLAEMMESELVTA